VLGAMKGLGTFLTRVRAVYLPVLYRPLYVGQATFRQLDEFLRAHGLTMVVHDQSVPGHWGYAVFVRTPAERTATSLTRPPRQATRQLPFARGGVGDLLQYVPAALEAKEIRVYSHFPQAAGFFSRIGVIAEHVPFEANTARLAWAEAGTELARECFPRLPLPPSALRLRRAPGGRVIGLHPYGSPYSNTFAARSGAPAKWMPQEYVTALLGRVLTPVDQVLLFCSPQERRHVQATLGPLESSATVVACPDLWDSFSMVTECDAVVAVDSSIKTVASMMGVPTVTLVGDFVEPFRDRHFLGPYVQRGVMRTVRYTQLGDREVDQTLSALRALNLWVSNGSS